MIVIVGAVISESSQTQLRESSPHSLDHLSPRVIEGTVGLLNFPNWRRESRLKLETNIPVEIRMLLGNVSVTTENIQME